MSDKKFLYIITLVISFIGIVCCLAFYPITKVWTFVFALISLSLIWIIIRDDDDGGRAA